MMRAIESPILRGMLLGIAICVVTAILLPMILELYGFLQDLLFPVSIRNPFSFPRFAALWVVFAYIGAIHLAIPSVLGGLMLALSIDRLQLRERGSRKRIVLISVAIGGLVGSTSTVSLLSFEETFPILAIIPMFLLLILEFYLGGWLFSRL
jgi:hypothetical protein